MIDVMRIQIVASRGRGVREGEKGLKRNESGSPEKTFPVGCFLNSFHIPPLRAPLPRKTSCAAQVALQHCPILHMSKRKSMIPTEFHTVNWLNLLRKPGSKPSGQVAQFAPDLRLRRTGISTKHGIVGERVSCSI